MRHDLSTATLRVRDIYRIGYDVLRRNGTHMILLLLATAVPAAVVETALNSYFGVDPLAGTNAGYGLLTSTAAWLVNAIALIYLMQLTADDLRERPVIAVALFSVVGRRYIPMLIGYFLTMLLFLIGMVLFIVPGIVVMVLLAFFPAFLVIENEEIFSSFSKSYRLVKGHFFHVLGMSLALLLPVLLVVFLLQAAVNNAVTQFLVLVIGNTLNFYFIIMITVFFLNVRRTWREADAETAALADASPETAGTPAAR